jgi:hypothetical protein
MMKTAPRRQFGIFLLILLGLILPVAASIGVGVGTGKIQVDEKLRGGMIYQLPPITVINTGDVAADYSITITYFEVQPQLKPSQDWFTFTPEKVYLGPNESKNIAIKLSLPLKVVPGDYFAFLEAAPVKITENGNTNIGVAAAAKLYFTIAPSSFLEGIYYRVLSFWNINQPWTNRGAIALGVVFMLLIFKKFFHIEINTKSTKKGPKKESISQL